MADPTNPTTPATPDTTDAAAKAKLAAAGIDLHKDVDGMIASYKRMHEASQTFDEDTVSSGQKLEWLTGYFRKAGTALDNMGNLVGSSATKFGLLTTALIGAKPVLENYTNGLDSRRLGSFSEQANSLIDIVGRQGTGLGIASAAGGKLLDVLKNMGLTGRELAEVMKMSGTQLAAFAKNVMVSADNSLRFQSILIQGATRSGDYLELQKQIGSNMQHLNQTTSQYINVMKNASQATGIGADQMTQFYADMMKIPGGIEAMNKGMDIGGKRMDSLTSIIRLAQGAGLDLGETFQDINKFTQNLGVGITDATKLVARFADVSTDLKAPVDVVREAIVSTTDKFRQYLGVGTDSAKMQQGLTDSVKGWASALEKAGVPAKMAVEEAAKYTSQMSDMNEAQEAFVSQSTGGPGGIGGAFAFEKLMKSDPAAAAKKMTEALKKASGGSNLVSYDDVGKGNAAADAQYMKQRQIMMSGMLGVKAGSKGEADQMIEALRKGGPIAGTSEEDKTKSMLGTMEQGKKQEELSMSAVKQASITAEYASLQAGNINLGTVQNAATGLSGQADKTGVNNKGRESVLAAQRAGETHAVSPGTASVLKDASQMINSGIPNLITGGFHSLMDQVQTPPTAQEQMDNAMSGMTPATTPTPVVQPTDKGKVPPTIPGLGGTGFGGSGKTPTIPGLGGGAYNPPGKQVANVIPGLGGQGGGTGTTPATKGGGTTPTTIPGLGGGNNGPIPVTLAPGTSLTVNFVGTCPHCGTHVNTSEQARARNTPSQT